MPCDVMRSCLAACKPACSCQLRLDCECGGWVSGMLPQHGQDVCTHVIDTGAAGVENRSAAAGVYTPLKT
jgi:hypothetical protein